MPLTVSASEARASFPRIAREVNENNIEVTVLKDSRPYVKIVPIGASGRAVQADGAAAGEAYLSAYAQAADEYRDLFEALA